LRICRHYEKSIQPSIVSKDKKGYCIPLPGDGKYADIIKASRYIREQELEYLTDAKAKLNEANADIERKYKMIPRTLRNTKIQEVFI
jgi:hypothetical protein